jgi:hypothetical protein
MGVVVVAISYYLGLVRLAILCGVVPGPVTSVHCYPSTLPKACFLGSSRCDWTAMLPSGLPTGFETVNAFATGLLIQGLREKPTSIFRAIRSNAQFDPMERDRCR